MTCRRTKMQGKTYNDMETGYHDCNGREESTGRRLDGQRMVENFGNRKALKDSTNKIMMKFCNMYRILRMRMQFTNAYTSHYSCI
jgi:hypothetical protein